MDCKHRWTTHEISGDVLEHIENQMKIIARMQNAVAILTGIQQPHAVKVEDSHIPEAGTSA
jgi:hypothetical protein